MTSYTGRVWIDHWHDGDTFYGVIDAGWNLTLGNERTKLERVRIAGIDAPELGNPYMVTDENRAGHESLEYAKAIAPEKRWYDYVGHNRDKYGRPLMDITVKPVDVLPASANLPAMTTFAGIMLAKNRAVVMK